MANRDFLQRPGFLDSGPHQLRSKCAAWDSSGPLLTTTSRSFALALTSAEHSRLCANSGRLASTDRRSRISSESMLTHSDARKFAENRANPAAISPESRSRYNQPCLET